MTLDPTSEQETEQVPATETPAEETEQTPAVEPEQPPVDPAPQTEPETEPEPELPPLEERYRQQRSEALILNAQVKQKDEILTKLTSQDAPSEAELLARYPEYQQMDAVSKRFVVDLLTNERRQARLDRQLAESEADKKWQQELRDLTLKDEYRSLSRDPEFERFVFQPKHKGLDIQTLADAYLMRTGKVPADERQVQRQPAMPTADNKPPAKKTKVSLEEASVIRKTDHKRYLALVKAGMIDDDI